jgi:hypothetical protein
MASSLRDNPAMQNDQAPRAHHDMGGLPASPIAQTEHDYALWEKRVDALMVLLSRRSLLTVDELRRNIEGLGSDAYDRMTYYERWVYAITQTADRARRDQRGRAGARDRGGARPRGATCSRDSARVTTSGSARRTRSAMSARRTTSAASAA